MRLQLGTSIKVLWLKNSFDHLITKVVRKVVSGEIGGWLDYLSFRLGNWVGLAIYYLLSCYL